MSEMGSTQNAEKEQPDPLRLCCCHGHLDGLTLDEMSALGAPCPTAAYVRERMAQAWVEGWDAGCNDAAYGGTDSPYRVNPYRLFPPGSSTPEERP